MAGGKYALEEGGLSLAKMKLLRHLNTARKSSPPAPWPILWAEPRDAADGSDGGEGLVRRVPGPDDPRSVRAQYDRKGAGGTYAVS